MHKRQNNFARGPALVAAAAAVAAAFAPPASAQNAPTTAQTTERIEVTGTNIRRVEGEGALPVTVLSRQQIERTGATNAMELLNYVTANNSLGNISLTSVIGAATNSVQTASLRGLQGGHTLVLINGKRVNNTAGETQGVQGVNLAIIPFSAIERVEILKDGASAVYGSDAIAGVINFILRSDYRGAEVMAFYGAPTRSGGGAEEKYSGSLGFGDLNKDRYNVYFNAAFDHQKPLDQKDRDFSKTSIILPIGYFAGSSNTFPGRISTGGIGIPGHTPPDCGNPDNQYLNLPDVGLVGCFYDPARTPGVMSITDDKNLNLYAQGKFQINANWQLYGQGLYSKDENHYTIQPVPISNLFTYGPAGALLPATITIQPTSPFYPHDAAAAAGVDGQPLNVRYRATESGNRDTTDTNTGYQIVGGIKGTIATRWDTDLSYGYSQGELHNHVNGGFPLYSRILPLLNSGTVNLFAPNTPAIQQQLRDTSFVGDAIVGTATTQAVNGKISGDLFDWRGGTVAGAAGVDLRREKLDQTPAHEYTVGDISGYGGNANPISASRDVTAFYAEVNVPILKSLEVDAAIRTDNYSDFGRTNNPKFSLRWQPTHTVLFRTSWGTGFLAPTLYQLDNPATSGVSPTGQSDPIRCPVTHDTGFDCGTQFATVNGGNPELQPEKSEQTTIGMVFEPNTTWSISADYFKIRLKNGITTGIPVPSILANLDLYGHFVTRGPPTPDFPDLPGRITGIDQRFINLGATHIEGVDSEFHYRFPTQPWGRVRFDISGTYYWRYDEENLDGSFTGIVGNSLNSPVVGVIPRWKHYATLSLDSGPWSVSVAQNYQTGYIDFQTDLDGNERRVGTLSLWDLQGVYTGFKHFTFTLGVKNVFDRNPPLTNQQNTFQAGYDPSYYDARARFVYGSIRYEWK
jgi:iron complex outermembrane receptor protein